MKRATARRSMVAPMSTTFFCTFVHKSLPFVDVSLHLATLALTCRGGFIDTEGNLELGEKVKLR